MNRLTDIADHDLANNWNAELLSFRGKRDTHMCLTHPQIDCVAHLQVLLVLFAPERYKGLLCLCRFMKELLRDEYGF